MRSWTRAAWPGSASGTGHQGRNNVPSRIERVVPDKEREGFPRPTARPSSPTSSSKADFTDPPTRCSDTSEPSPVGPLTSVTTTGLARSSTSSKSAHRNSFAIARRCDTPSLTSSRAMSHSAVGPEPLLLCQHSAHLIQPLRHPTRVNGSTSAAAASGGVHVPIGRLSMQRDKPKCRLQRLIPGRRHPQVDEWRGRPTADWWYPSMLAKGAVSP